MSVNIETKKNILGQFSSFCALCKEKIIHKDKEDCHENCPYGNMAKDIGKEKDDMDYEFSNNEINQVLLGNEYRSPLSQKIAVKKFSLKRDFYKIIEDSNPFADELSVKYEKRQVKFSDLYYLNISRLIPFIRDYGFEIDMQRYNENKSMRKQGWLQKDILDRFEDVFSKLDIDAISFNKIKSIHEDYIGELAYFDKLDFHFKNISAVVKKEEDYAHVYFIHDNAWKLVLYVNKNWIATDQALELFSSLKTQPLSGIFRVTNVESSERTIYGTPFSLALPK